jgi:hypothetical protein
MMVAVKLIAAIALTDETVVDPHIRPKALRTSPAEGRLHFARFDFGYLQ